MVPYCDTIASVQARLSVKEMWPWHFGTLGRWKLLAMRSHRMDLILQALFYSGTSSPITSVLGPSTRRRGVYTSRGQEHVRHSPLFFPSESSLNLAIQTLRNYNAQSLSTVSQACLKRWSRLRN